MKFLRLNLLSNCKLGIYFSMRAKVPARIAIESGRIVDLEAGNRSKIFIAYFTLNFYLRARPPEQWNFSKNLENLFILF